MDFIAPDRDTEGVVDRPAEEAVRFHVLVDFKILLPIEDAKVIAPRGETNRLTVLAELHPHAPRRHQHSIEG